MQQTASLLTLALMAVKACVPLPAIGIFAAGCQKGSPAKARSIESARRTGATPTTTAQSAPRISAAPTVWKWNFDTDRPGKPPAGFSFRRTGNGDVGAWVIVVDDGHQFLGQLGADATSFRFPVAVADEPRLRDVRVSVRCKPVSGTVDQACGLVARYQDENNYLVTRANALEGNVRLYTVKSGRREQIADHTGPVSANAWHELRLELRGDRIQVAWDRRQVLSHRDVTFPNAGRVGVWTKADSITYFDDLIVEAL